MFYKIFTTTFLVFLIHVFFKAKPEWKDNSGTSYKVIFCIFFMLAQSIIIASIIMIIYNIWN